MVEQERRRETIGFVPNELASEVAGKTVAIQICGCTVYLPRVIPSNVLAIIFGFVALIVLSQSQIFPLPEQNNCFAILVFASILWAFEAIPLFVTSNFIPVLVVFFKCPLYVKKNVSFLGGLILLSFFNNVVKT